MEVEVVGGWWVVVGGWWVVSVVVKNPKCRWRWWWCRRRVAAERGGMQQSCR